MARIIHPHPGFTGSVGPVNFTNGRAETDDPDMAAHLEALGCEVHYDAEHEPGCNDGCDDTGHLLLSDEGSPEWLPAAEDPDESADDTED